MGGACSSHEGREMTGKPEEKRLLRKPRYKWENNIKMNPTEIC
jgi:hypothetical protein